MLGHRLSRLVLFLPCLPLSTATWSAYQEYLSSLPKHIHQNPTTAPPPVLPCPPPPPHSLGPPPPSPKTCIVPTHNDFRSDDTPLIQHTLNTCSTPGSHILFPLNKTYLIASPLNLQNLSHLTLEIQSYIHISNSTTYWSTHSFPQTYQNATTFFELGGTNLTLFGQHGMLDGNGQAWYNLYPTNASLIRPVLFGIRNLHHSTISSLKLRFSPFWYFFARDSSHLTFSSLSIAGSSQTPNITAKNTDGWDVYRSSDIAIRDSVIQNGDDCVSFKPNSSRVVVENLRCEGSHGISVGSLGQYPGETDIVEDIFVRNITLLNATDGARIKVWPGASTALSSDLQGGGGSGFVRNITYTDIRIQNTDYAIEVTQCYGQKNLTACNEYPSNLTISDVRISNVRGTTSQKYAPISGYLVCNSKNVCSGIQLSDIDVVAPDGTKNEFTCGLVDQDLLHGINCSPVNKGGN